MYILLRYKDIRHSMRTSRRECDNLSLSQLINVYCMPASSTSLPVTHAGTDNGTFTNYINSTDPQCMWSFLESIGPVTCHPPSNQE